MHNPKHTNNQQHNGVYYDNLRAKYEELKSFLRCETEKSKHTDKICTEKPINSRPSCTNQASPDHLKKTVNADINLRDNNDCSTEFLDKLIQQPGLNSKMFHSTFALNVHLKMRKYFKRKKVMILIGKSKHGAGVAVELGKILIRAGINVEIQDITFSSLPQNKKNFRERRIFIWTNTGPYDLLIVASDEKIFFRNYRTKNYCFLFHEQDVLECIEKSVKCVFIPGTYEDAKKFKIDTSCFEMQYIPLIYGAERNAPNTKKIS